MKIVKTRTPEAVTVDIDAIPSYQSDAMCRTLIGCVGRLFENPDIQADYKRWQQERQKMKEKRDIKGYETRFALTCCRKTTRQ